MTLELSFVNHDEFSNESILNKAILVSHSLPLTFFHELSTENLSIAAVLDEDAIRLHKLLVPQEDVVLVAMSYRAVQSTVLTLCNLDDLVHGKSVIVFISAVQCSVAWW